MFLYLKVMWALYLTLTVLVQDFSRRTSPLHQLDWHKCQIHDLFSHLHTSFLFGLVYPGKTCWIFRGEAQVAANGFSSRVRKLVRHFCGAGPYYTVLCETLVYLWHFSFLQITSLGPDPKPDRWFQALDIRELWLGLIQSQQRQRATPVKPIVQIILQVGPVHFCQVIN